MRDVQINSTLFIELKKQYEIARIEEIRNTPVVSLMDAARPAAFRDRPRKRIIVLIGFLIALFGSITYVVLSEIYKTEISTLISGLRESLKR